MKLLFILVLTFVFAFSVSAQNAKMSVNDLKTIEGKQWVGNLTYVNYGSGKKVSIPSNLTVTRSNADRNIWVFDYQYPDEPKANGKSDIKLSSDGKMFNDGSVIEKQKLPGGVLKFVTTKDGMDDNKPSLLRYTYLVSKRAFSIKKEVRTEGSAEFFERNTYRWTR